jgi:hypothetical protein
MKVVHFHLYDPSSGLHLFGKPKANTPTEYQYVECSNAENCQLLKQGQCAMTTFLSKNCPYGTYRRAVGPTKRAKSFRDWQNEARKKFEGVPYLKSPPAKLAIVGEYVYVPYAHANMNESLPFGNHGGFMRSGSNFLKLSDFTEENIQKIIDFRPQALFGGTIWTYQTEEVPKFLTHLQEVMPNLYSRILELRPDYIERYKLNAPKNYVGRKAFVRTLAPCTFLTKGSREGNYKVKWTWDGQKLTTDTDHAYSSTWGDVKEYESVTTTIVPSEKSVIEITDNCQVGPQTIFVD